MPSARLQQQFIRLWQCCEGKSQDTTLNELGSVIELLASSYAYPAQHHAGSRLADVGSGSRAR
ncbi:putative substrate-binding protein [Escherichia coli]|uniref:Putative substrate-binding protein n=1 Tax=Escherichia coli TaxID=562 RepID=A0A376TL56_ECOLX|nr:putative substrate-binding protein [Escherichia coli]